MVNTKCPKCGWSLADDGNDEFEIWKCNRGHCDYAMKRKKVECNHCKVDTATRIVIERYPLEKLVLSNEYVEFLCINIIKFKKKGRDINNWVKEDCRNRMLIKKKYLNDETFNI